MNFIAEHWAEILVVVLIIQNVVKGIRDAIDTTPLSDDTTFERVLTIISKVTDYVLMAKRSK